MSYSFSPFSINYWKSVKNWPPTFTSTDVILFTAKKIKFIIFNMHQWIIIIQYQDENVKKIDHCQCPQSSFKGAGMTSAKTTPKPKSRKRKGAKQNPQTLRHLVPPISCLVFYFSSNSIVSGRAERQSRDETYCLFLALYFASLETLSFYISDPLL